MHGLAAEVGAVILAPQAGVAPITQAPTGLDFTVYLIDNRTIQAGQRGVPIHVLLAPNPYDGTAAVPAEHQVLARIPDSTAMCRALTGLCF